MVLMFLAETWNCFCVFIPTYLFLSIMDIRFHSAQSTIAMTLVERSLSYLAFFLVGRACGGGGWGGGVIRELPKEIARGDKVKVVANRLSLKAPVKEG